MKMYDIFKKVRRSELRGEIRHTGVDEMLTELYKRVAELEIKVFKEKQGRGKPPKDKDGNNVSI